MSEPREAREVIARAIIDEMERYRLILSWTVAGRRADAIFAALDASGYEIVAKRERISILGKITGVVDPRVPEGEVWITPDDTAS